MRTQNLRRFPKLLLGAPYAAAGIHGDPSHKSLHGGVYLYPAGTGTLVVAEVYNLPPNTFHGFHIHEGKYCTGTASDPFANAGKHYNPTNTTHPNHAGDLPVLLSDKNGYAYMTVYTSRFSPDQVVGRTAIIHADPDDFRTQPSGNSGPMIACGEIKKV